MQGLSFRVTEKACVKIKGRICVKVTGRVSIKDKISIGVTGWVGGKVWVTINF